MASDASDGDDPSRVGFLKLQGPIFARSRKFTDVGRITGKTWRRTRLGFPHILSLGRPRKIRGRLLQKSLYFVSVSSGNKLEIICVQPFLRVVILSPEWRFRDSQTILDQVVSSLFSQLGEFLGDSDEEFRLGR